jgi:hypothetical protein
MILRVQPLVDAVPHSCSFRSAQDFATPSQEPVVGSPIQAHPVWPLHTPAEANDAQLVSVPAHVVGENRQPRIIPQSVWDAITSHAVGVPWQACCGAVVVPLAPAVAPAVPPPAVEPAAPASPVLARGGVELPHATENKAAIRNEEAQARR